VMLVVVGRWRLGAAILDFFSEASPGKRLA